MYSRDCSIREFMPKSSMGSLLTSELLQIMPALRNFCVFLNEAAVCPQLQYLEEVNDKDG
jgi:hypothetical protein